MLLDPSLQQVIQECGDPRRFQQYMQDPTVAYKLKKLYAAGLLGIAK